MLEGKGRSRPQMRNTVPDPQRVGFGKAMTPKEMERVMRVNAEVYQASVLDPFNVRGARIPDPSPFPSTVGTCVMRFHPTSVTDDVKTTNTFCGMEFRTDITTNGIWTNEIKSVNSGAVTWTGTEHPHVSDFSDNFAYIRTVSMGIRLCNIGPLVKRGGALYVSYSPQEAATSTLADLKLADETEVYDAARLEEEGMQAVYVPMSKQPVLRDVQGMVATGAIYVDPAADFSGSGNMCQDTNIFVWMEGLDDTDHDELLEMEIEQVHNWEAIPHPANEFLFQRRAMVSSESAKAVASGTVSAPAVTTGVKRGMTLMDHAKSAATTVGHSALQQIESLAMRGLGALPGLLFSLLDMRKHKLANTLGYPELSPTHDERVKQLTWDDFVMCVLTRFARDKGVTFGRQLAREQSLARPKSAESGTSSTSGVRQKVESWEFLTKGIDSKRKPRVVK
jgi:hypothetical protein